MPTPERPAYLVEWNVGGSAIRKTNAIAPPGALFAFGLDTAAGRAPQSDAGIARYYAGMDIVGLQTGSLVTSIDGNQYRAARPAWIQAGRDIVNLKGLILNQRPNDVSRIAAGRGILYANVDIAGPGWLEIIAGRNLTQEDRGRLGSVGLIDGKPATGKGGAGIVVSVGGEGDYTAFARRYLDPGNRADPGQTLASQPGKVVHTYERELADWLRVQDGYTGSDQDVLARFEALPLALRQAFLRSVYFAELRAGGREYNDLQGPRPGSYLRGRRISRRCSRKARRAKAASRCSDRPACAASAAARSSCWRPAARSWSACRSGAAGQRGPDHAGPGRHPGLFQGQPAAGAVARDDDLRRRHPGLVGRG